jgi:hypothetical protein
VGCKRAFVPHNFSGAFDGIVLHRIHHINDALEAITHRW